MGPPEQLPRGLPELLHLQLPRLPLCLVLSLRGSRRRRGPGLGREADWWALGERKRVREMKRKEQWTLFFFFHDLTFFNIMCLGRFSACWGYEGLVVELGPLLGENEWL